MKRDLTASEMRPLVLKLLQKGPVTVREAQRVLPSSSVRISITLRTLYKSGYVRHVGDRGRGKKAIYELVKMPPNPEPRKRNPRI